MVHINLMVMRTHFLFEKKKMGSVFKQGSADHLVLEPFDSGPSIPVLMCDFSAIGNSFSSNSGEELEQQRLELEIDSEPPESPTGVEIITDPEFWAENDRKIEERMKLRKERLRHFCENVYRNISDDRKWDFHQKLWLG